MHPLSEGGGLTQADDEQFAWEQQRMSTDFSSHRLFAGTKDSRRVCDAVVGELRRYFQRLGLDEVVSDEWADRSFVIRTAGRWIFLGDSAGSTDTCDSSAFDALSRVLSNPAPVVDVKMCDSATVHFYLYRKGEVVDRFGNGKFPFMAFSTKEEAAPYAGKPELWADLLLDPASVPTLRKAWVQRWDASNILSSTAALFGWEPELLWLGYTHDDEGCGMKYDEYLQRRRINMDGFQELHFSSLMRRTDRDE